MQDKQNVKERKKGRNERSKERKLVNRKKKNQNECKP